MVLAESRGAALNKGFADIKKSGGNSGFRSKVGVRLQLGVRLVIQDLRYVQWRSGLKLWTRLQTLNYENETMWCCVEPWASLFTRHCSNSLSCVNK